MRKRCRRFALLRQLKMPCATQTWRLTVSLTNWNQSWRFCGCWIACRRRKPYSPLLQPTCRFPILHRARIARKSASPSSPSRSRSLPGRLPKYYSEGRRRRLQVRFHLSRASGMRLGFRQGLNSSKIRKAGSRLSTDPLKPNRLVFCEHALVITDILRNHQRCAEALLRSAARFFAHVRQARGVAEQA